MSSTAASQTAFTLLAKDSTTGARLGTFATRHGSISTPQFMPVGTQATVKAMTPAQLKEVGANIILGNTYHLALRPGPDLIRELGGLHGFMGWDGAILTDSGGFQVFSLSKLRQVTDEGIAFQSHIDGSKFFLGPREAMAWQEAFGSDIAMVIDECPPWPCSHAEAVTAVERSVRWAGQCFEFAGSSGFLERGHHLFGIVQGSAYPDLRRACAEQLCEWNFSGYAVGGVSVGEPEVEMLAQVSASVPFLPSGKPRYAMGLGTPPQILKMIALGIDLFDCVLPTRLARHGSAFTPHGVIHLRNQRFRHDPAPLVEGLDNYTCRKFSRAYLRHLLVAGEMLGPTLLTLHNLHFYLDLLAQARKHLADGSFGTWHQAWIERYEMGSRGDDLSESG